MKFTLTFFIFSLLYFQVEAGNKDTISLGKIRVIIKNQSLIIPAETAIDSGILEYMAVTPTGKKYESVMVLHCDPKIFHAALLLINAQSGDLHIPKKNEGYRLEGDTLDLTVIYTDQDTLKKMPVLDLISYRNPTYAKKDKDLKKDINWIFTGSSKINYDGKGNMVPASVITGSLIAIFIDDAAEINFSQTTKTPYQGDTYGFCVNTEVIRKLGKNYFLEIKKKN